MAQNPAKTWNNRRTDCTMEALYWYSIQFQECPNPINLCLINRNNIERTRCCLLPCFKFYFNYNGVPSPRISWCYFGKNDFYKRHRCELKNCPNKNLYKRNQNDFYLFLFLLFFWKILLPLLWVNLIGRFRNNSKKLAQNTTSVVIYYCRTAWTLQTIKQRLKTIESHCLPVSFNGITNKIYWSYLCTIFIHL